MFHPWRTDNHLTETNKEGLYDDTTVEIIKIDGTDKPEGTVIFDINGRQYNAFYWGDN